MPYITPPPVLPTDVGTDFLLDDNELNDLRDSWTYTEKEEAIQAVEDHKNEIAREVAQEYDNGDDQDEGFEFVKLGADANEAEHRDIELSQRGWDEYYQ
jgi:hypothetical protein